LRDRAKQRPELSAGHTLWLDANAADWVWFVDPSPGDDSEFTTSGDQGEQHRVDLLTVPAHEVGHLLGRDPGADGLLAQTLTARPRPDPSSGSEPTDGAALDRAFADGRTSRAARSPRKRSCKPS
jgi:hypothetical protein